MKDELEYLRSVLGVESIIRAGPGSSSAARVPGSGSLAAGQAAEVEGASAAGVSDGGAAPTPDTRATGLAGPRDGSPLPGAARASAGSPDQAPPHHEPSAKNPELYEVYQAACQAMHCGLCHTRTNLVFGMGSPDAELMFVGEAPGATEDAQGKPFVGDAGLLLTRMINAMGLKREQVYIANVVKCRPPGNRNPTPEEVAGCRPFLDRQIEIVKPRVIVALGKFAAQTLLQTEQSISRLRGRLTDACGCKVMPTFHPAYLLRNPEAKKQVWEDLQIVMRHLGLKYF